MGDLLCSLRQVLIQLKTGDAVEKVSQKLIDAYNNNPELRRAKNTRPRTHLMVKGLTDSPFEQVGLIAMAAAAAMQLPESDYLRDCFQIA